MQNNNKKRGATLLIIVIFFFSITMIILASATSSVLLGASAHRAHTNSKFAYVASESIMEDALYRIINNQTLSASETLSLNGATGKVDVVTISASEKDLYATGSSSARVNKQYLKTIKTGGIISLNYAVQSGDSGVSLLDSSTIIGDTFASGAVTGMSMNTVSGNLTIASPISPDTTVQSTGCVQDEMPGKVSPNIDYAQSFIPATTDKITKVSLYIKRVGSPSTQAVKIVSDYFGSPSTTPIVSTVLSFSSATTNYSWVEITFATPPTLTAGTRYWIVLDAGVDASNYWYWCRSTTDDYVDGLSKYAQDWLTGTWTVVSSSVDMAFQTYWGEGESKATGVQVGKTIKADSIVNSTITNDAYYKTISGSSVGGVSFPASPTPPDVPPPLSNATIAKWKADATAGGTYSGEYRVSGATASFGPKLITGNLRVEDSTFTVTGTLYVMGQVRFERSLIRCDPAYGANSCVIFSEQWDRVRDGSFAGSGTAGSHLVLGTSAAGTLAFEDRPENIVFLAPNGIVSALNRAYFKSIYAKGVILGDSSTVEYDPTLANINVSASTVSGSSSYWGVTRWNTR